MTDRRRNFVVLVLVGLLLGGAIAVILSKETRQGLDLKGGIELVYQAKATKFAQVTGESIERSLEIMRERVDRLGVAEPEIQRSGEDQISVSLPDVENQERAIRQVGTTAQMFFYDWEPNVLNDECEPAPTDPNVTGGQAAGQPGAGSLSYYQAVSRAADCPRMEEGLNTSRDAPAYYLVDDDAQLVLAGPEPSREDLFTELDPPQTGPEDGQSVKTVDPGVVVVKADIDDEGDQDTDANPIDVANQSQYYVLRDDFALRGTDIKDPEQNFDQGPGGSGSPLVTFNFTDEGAKIWQEVTREIVQRGQASLLPGQPVESANQHFAVVLDNELITVPFIDFQQNPDGIDGSNGSQIEGGFTITSAQDLANQLKYGALPIELELISSSQVSATLGQEALDQGLKAGIAGFAIVCLFLLLFYRVLGAIAVTGLVVYGIYFFALIKLIPITMTLPGIAGLILTIGVAADANIVIFERIKEEIRAGRSISNGIAQGYKKGLSAIIDANVVTFMVAFILFVLATAGVKGFAFVLGIGTLVSLFTAVLATQAVLGTTGHTRLMSRPSALGAGKPQREFKFDYMGRARWFFVASGVILVIGAVAIGEKGLNFGIDFESGTRIRVALEQPTDVDGVRAALEPAGQAEAEIQQISDEELGDNAFQISTETLAPDEVTDVTNVLDEEFGLAQPPNTQSVGPTFGNTVAESAIIAIIASLLVIAAYITLRFEWKYAVPVLIAVMHDILITAGIYSLTDREVTTSTVAALLTILGFSLYDTIIVFDRVRENVPRMPRAAFSQVVNRSMSEVIVRSVATSICTALPVFGLLMFGGETLTDFAFALLVGTISGTYSSIFIAGPVLVHWKETEQTYRTRRRRIAEANGGVVPAYATGNAAVEVAVREDSRPKKRLTTPDLPGEQVSPTEFQELVRDLHADVPADSIDDDSARDLTPDEVVMPEDPNAKKDKKRGPRNRRHGRSR